MYRKHLIYVHNPSTFSLLYFRLIMTAALSTCQFGTKTTNCLQFNSQLGCHYVDYILELSDIDGHWKETAERIRPSGKIASITENRKPVDLKLLTPKRATFVWEWMFTKSYFQTEDMITQQQILNRIARLLDEGKLKSTVTQKLTPINIENLKQAHKLVETSYDRKGRTDSSARGRHPCVSASRR